VNLTKKSSITGREHTMDLPITQEQLDRYERREGLVQQIFPDLSPDLREFVMTGITPEEWDRYMKDPEC
jgi:hypothetical protein